MSFPTASKSSCSREFRIPTEILVSRFTASNVRFFPSLADRRRSPTDVPKPSLIARPSSLAPSHDVQRLIDLLQLGHQNASFAANLVDDLLARLADKLLVRQLGVNSAKLFLDLGLLVSQSSHLRGEIDDAL